LTRLREERTKNATLHEQLSRAQEAVALARGRYEAGLTPLTPVLNGQGAALTAERDIATSDAALDRDMVSLFKALGG
jgi:outer membrane protein TolC